MKMIMVGMSALLLVFATRSVAVERNPFQPAVPLSPSRTGGTQRGVISGDAYPDKSLKIVSIHYSKNNILLKFNESPIDYQLSTHGHQLQLYLPQLALDHSQLKAFQNRAIQMQWVATDQLQWQFARPIQAYLKVSHRQIEIRYTYPTSTTDPFVSLQVHQAPCGRLLQWLADLAQQNMILHIPSDKTLHLTLHHVRWDEAMEAIAEAAGLTLTKSNQVWMIRPTDEVLAQRQQQLKEQLTAQQLQGLDSVTVRVRYAKAAELLKIIQTTLHHQLAANASLAADGRTNTIIIQAHSAMIEKVKQLIMVLDQPVREVDIASRMITIRTDDNRELGVQWQVGGHANGDVTEGGFNVQLPVAQATSSVAFKFAKLASGTALDLELSALAQENRGKIIASPRVVTANQQTAYIEQGREIPYVESASSGAASVTFKKAVLSLKVTPQITPDNRIILDLVITQDTEGDAVQTPLGRAVAINTQEIQTQVSLNNGETIVLGGIYQQQRQKMINKVPLISEIPAIGSLFQYRSTTLEKSELLIFVTPKIVNSSVNG
ncbi:type IV pilus secretin PilQ [Celerinatantimonas sp. YJH-8]|uniref:type IV pilus secretin PilQ n=1 Tax=Celerinatantimonas sp. YJH-8 TaxID=3228714 RepID=UPI0038C3F020